MEVLLFLSKHSHSYLKPEYFLLMFVRVPLHVYMAEFLEQD